MIDIQYILNKRDGLYIVWDQGASGRDSAGNTIMTEYLCSISVDGAIAISRNGLMGKSEYDLLHRFMDIKQARTMPK